MRSTLPRHRRLLLMAVVFVSPGAAMGALDTTFAASPPTTPTVTTPVTTVRKPTPPTSPDAGPKPVQDKPPADKPPANKPPADKPAPAPQDKPSQDKPPANKPPAGKPPQAPQNKPAQDKPPHDKPAPAPQDKPPADKPPPAPQNKPAQDKPPHDKPAHDKPAADKPVPVKPPADKPPHDKPSHPEPAVGHQPHAQHPKGGPADHGHPAPPSPSTGTSAPTPSATAPPTSTTAPSSNTHRPPTSTTPPSTTSPTPAHPRAGAIGGFLPVAPGGSGREAARPASGAGRLSATSGAAAPGARAGGRPTDHPSRAGRAAPAEAGHVPRVFLERIGPSLWHRQAMPLLGVALVVVAFAVVAVTRMRRRV